MKLNSIDEHKAYIESTIKGSKHLKSKLKSCGITNFKADKWILDEDRTFSYDDYVDWILEEANLSDESQFYTEICDIYKMPFKSFKHKSLKCMIYIIANTDNDVIAFAFTLNVS